MTIHFYANFLWVKSNQYWGNSEVHIRRANQQSKPQRVPQFLWEQSKNWFLFWIEKSSAMKKIKIKFQNSKKKESDFFEMSHQSVVNVKLTVFFERKNVKIMTQLKLTQLLANNGDDGRYEICENKFSCSFLAKNVASNLPQLIFSRKPCPMQFRAVSFQFEPFSFLTIILTKKNWFISIYFDILDFFVVKIHCCTCFVRPMM